MQSKLVVLGTGGTIAGRAGQAQDHVRYRAAQIGVEELLAALPGVDLSRIECEQVVQINSKDMSHEVLRRLCQRVEHHLQRPEVGGIVITHGTDTLEESAYFLHRVLGPRKPVVLTAAMRPATALVADGPQNLSDAIRLAVHPDAAGVLVTLAAKVWAGCEVRKVHTHSLDAFAGGDAGPVALVRAEELVALRPWPVLQPHACLGLRALPEDTSQWPWVMVLPSHGGADARLLRLALDAGLQGLVLEGTGNGSVHQELLAVINGQLQSRPEWRRRILVSTRCAFGGVVGQPDHELPSSQGLTPGQARLALMLDLIGKP